MSIKKKAKLKKPPGSINKPLKVQAFEIHQGDITLYAFKANASVLYKSFSINRRIEDCGSRRQNGCVVLLDHNRRSRRKGKIFVVRTEDGLVVKRAGKDPGGRWQLLSDHPAWPPQPWARAMVIGEVKWMAREL